MIFHDGNAYATCGETRAWVRRETGRAMSLAGSAAYVARFLVQHGGRALYRFNGDDSVTRYRMTRDGRLQRQTYAAGSPDAREAWTRLKVAESYAANPYAGREPEKPGRVYRTYERQGFLISRTAGSDAPWRGWREDGASFRADTLKGAFAMANREARS